MLQAMGKPLKQYSSYSAARVLLALVLFGMSFGYVEAAVVVYLRPLYEPLHERFHPNFRKSELFPLLRADELATRPEVKQCFMVELGRETATLIMLAAAGLAVAHNFHQ